MSIKHSNYLQFATIICFITGCGSSPGSRTPGVDSSQDSNTNSKSQPSDGNDDDDDNNDHTDDDDNSNDNSDDDDDDDDSDDDDNDSNDDDDDDDDSDDDDDNSDDGPKFDIGFEDIVPTDDPQPPSDCGDSEDEDSGYIGCEYWPTITKNGVWRDYFNFAAVVINASDRDAKIVVSRAGIEIETVTVPVGGLEIINLPWVFDLKGDDMDDGTGYPLSSGANFVRGGAYKLKSDRPVTVYQFNALRYENTDSNEGCPTEVGNGGCYSFSNDASLLLPTPSLTPDYITTGWGANGRNLDLIAITATKNNTKVTITSTNGLGASNGAPALQAGQPVDFMMNEGDVLQYVSASAGFPGTQVRADKPVQVISGHPCTTLPNATTPACDHIEETVLPVQAFGKDHIVSAPITDDGKIIFSVRVHGIFDSTQLQFDPPAVSGPVTLDQGESVDILSATQNFRVRSNQSFGVTQYMHGEGLLGIGDGAGAGDPSQSTVIPTEQFREDYVFLAPEDYDASFVNIIAPMGTTVELDGNNIPGASFERVGNSDMQVARVKLQDIGVHEAHSDDPFGIVVYGYGTYTSYMYPGGAAVRQITDPPDPPGYRTKNRNARDLDPMTLSPIQDFSSSKSWAARTLFSD